MIRKADRANSAANLPSDCINLGQGYMNFAPPEWVKEGAVTALSDTSANHYSHPKGRIRLREAIRDYYSPSFERELNADTEILITSGANEGESFNFDPCSSHHFIRTICDVGRFP
jgi:kynurenine aminotransferase